MFFEVKLNCARLLRPFEPLIFSHGSQKEEKKGESRFNSWRSVQWKQYELEKLF